MAMEGSDSGPGTNWPNGSLSSASTAGVRVILPSLTELGIQGIPARSISPFLIRELESGSPSQAMRCSTSMTSSG